jgi:transcription antitermination factor NusG
LVSEETKVHNNLMKEEMAVVIRIDFDKKIVECTISSIHNETKIEIKNFEPNYIFTIQNTITAYILKEIN